MTEEGSEPLSGWRAVAVIGAIAAVVFFVTRVPTNHQPVGGPALDFKLPDLSGKPVALSDYKGKVVLVDFWATWCGPCQEEVPDLIALQQKYKDRGLVVLGVNMDSGAGAAAKVRSFAQTNGLTYPVLLSGGDTPAGYDVSGLPSAVLVDRQGNLARSYLGSRTLSEFAVDVQAVLSQ